MKKVNKFMAKLMVLVFLFTSINQSGLILPQKEVQASTIGTAVTLRPQADTFVESNNPTLIGNVTTGATSQLRVSGVSSSYIRFDFTPSNLTDIQSVSSAILAMSHSSYLTKDPTNSALSQVTNSVYMCTDDSWDVNLMNYNTKPTEEVYLGSFVVSSARNSRIKYIDLAQWVNQALENSSDRKITLKICLAEDSVLGESVYYQADENYFRPNLVITPLTLRENPSTPMPVVPATPIYYARHEAEAEYAVIAPGKVTADHMGFSGIGFADTANVKDAYIEWKFDMPEAGVKYLAFIYANHSSLDRPAALTVNGTVIAERPFTDTTAWNYWKYQLFSANLKAGENIVRLTATSTEGLANVDCLDIIGGPAPSPLPAPPSAEAEAFPYLPLGPVPDSVSAGTAIQLGNISILGVSELTYHKNLEMNRITLHQHAIVKSLSLYTEGGSGSMRMTLFNDDSGKPGTMIAKTNDFMVVPGWNTQDLNWQVQLLPTEDYWIGYQTDSDNIVVKTEASGGYNYSYAIGYSDGMIISLEGRYKTQTLKRYSMYANLVAVDPVSVAPGIGGFGIYTQGGRNGEIIHVTNLNDRGPGSLRAACEAIGPRIVVFDVSGYITLTGSIYITDPYITISGQTAPSPGISLKGAGIAIATHDVFIQHIRARIGDGLIGDTYEDRDVFQIVGDDKLHDIVIDHVSGSWSTDELISTWPSYDSDDVLARRKNIRNITLSNNLFGPPLNSNLHPKGGHPFGVMIGDSTSNIAVIGNYQGHTWQRAPVIKGGSSAYIANNIWFDNHQPATSIYADVSDTLPHPVLVSYIGNNWVKGPLTQDERIVNIHSYPASATNRFDWYIGTKVYFDEDNVYYGEKLWIDPGYETRWGDLYIAPLVETPPMIAQNYTPVSAKIAEKLVLANAGARPNERDSLDLKQLSDYNTRSGSYTSTVAEAGGWPALASDTRVFIEPENPNGDDDSDGYTNIEEVLQQMAADVEFNIADVEVLGADKLIIPTEGSVTYEFTAQVKDQKWQNVESIPITWSVLDSSNNPAQGIGISDDGKVTINSIETFPGTYTINAATPSTYGPGDIIGTKLLVIHDFVTLNSDGSVTILPTTSKDNLTGEVTASVGAAAINKALTIAQAGTNGIKTVTVDIPKVEGATAYLAKFQTQSLSTIDENSIVIKTDLGKVSVQSNMFNASDIAGKSIVALKIAPVTEATHSGKNADVNGHRPIIVLSALLDGEVAAWSNSSVSVTISMPYTLVKGEELHMDNIVVWYIDGRGRIITVPQAVYDEITGRITFDVNNF